MLKHAFKVREIIKNEFYCFWAHQLTHDQCFPPNYLCVIVLCKAFDATWEKSFAISESSLWSPNFFLNFTVHVGNKIGSNSPEEGGAEN